MQENYDLYFVLFNNNRHILVYCPDKRIISREYELIKGDYELL